MVNVVGVLQHNRWDERSQKQVLEHFVGDLERLSQDVHLVLQQDQLLALPCPTAKLLYQGQEFAKFDKLSLSGFEFLYTNEARRQVFNNSKLAIWIFRMLPLSNRCAVTTVFRFDFFDKHF